MIGLAGRLGGVAALDPRTGEVRALAGIAFSAPQPPGSTFKIVTTTAALENDAREAVHRVPRGDARGHRRRRARERERRGLRRQFRNSFAHSCNSVFAPLGVEIGRGRSSTRPSATAGTRPPTIPGEVASTLPPAAEIDTPLEVASTAIGQFETLATPLQMASVAQTIACGASATRPRCAPATDPAARA